ncbi:MAG: alpha/beta hydrolase-fold protein [Cyclonatronaceae bacterium]
MSRTAKTVLGLMFFGLVSALSFGCHSSDDLSETTYCTQSQLMTSQQLHFHLHSQQSRQQDDRPIYMSGNFNDWNPADERYRLTPDPENAHHFSITFEDISSLPDTLEYKFTRGGWENSELDRFGNEILNHTISRHSGCVDDSVPHWKRDGVAFKQAYRPIVNIINEHFEIPQLIKTRRIAALLPHDYYESDARYPVLYLQDGQNLFDDHAPFGSWELDKRLAFMAEHGLGKFIVIAIDHAEEERIAEFTPTLPTSRLGSGDGKKYARFLAETLKPYIDAHFRTKPEREYTGIGGSSMGGLISIYAAKQHPQVYSRLLLFSPSFWVTPGLPTRFVDEASDFSGKIYTYGGGDETAMLVGRLTEFHEKLIQAAQSRPLESRISINPVGKHTESEWSREFPMAASWLFGTVVE